MRSRQAQLVNLDLHLLLQEIHLSRSHLNSVTARLSLYLYLSKVKRLHVKKHEFILSHLPQKMEVTAQKTQQEVANTSPQLRVCSRWCKRTTRKSYEKGQTSQ